MITTYINKPDILKWYIYKILLIMRLTTVILMISMLQVSASTFTREFNYEKKGVSLIHIINEKQTANIISWDGNNIDVTNTEITSFKSATINNILDRVLSAHTNTSFKNDNIAEIREKGLPFLLELNVLLNFIDVRGRVVDENNRPLMGATVMIKGTKKATSTNSNGEFVLKDVDENAVLVISFLGYKSQDIKATEKLSDIQLVHVTDRLQEVEINAGYYTVKDRERTGNIARISAETIAKQPVSNFLLAMQGRVPGVEVIQQTGLPGGGIQVRIRGRNSIANGNDPLYIVDGVPVASNSMASPTLSLGSTQNASPLSFVSPADIESIDVLKDADATAIYGSRGANGVVLITTKKGKPGTTKVEANYAQGVGHVTSKIELLNTQQYLEMRREAFQNDQISPGASDYDLNGTWDQSRYTDWQKELIGGTANTLNGKLSFSGGNQSTTFLLSGNYYRETSVFPGKNSYQRGGGVLNVAHVSMDQRFRMQFSGNYNVEQNELPPVDLTFSIMLPPNAPVTLLDNGELNWEYGSFRDNPLAQLFRKYQANTETLVANTLFNYATDFGLDVGASIGYTQMLRNELAAYPLNSQYQSGTLTANNRFSNFADNSSRTFNFEPKLSYKLKLGEGELNVLAGATLLKKNQHMQTLRGRGYLNDGLIESISGAAAITVVNEDAFIATYKYISVFSRVNFNYRSRYLLNLTGRKDGSSRFGKDNMYANFGAVGAAWIFSDEPFFLDNMPFLSSGKLRMSYGLTGSDQIGDYNYLELWAPTSHRYQELPGLTPSRLFNPNYAWEINKKAEISLALGFLNHGINTELTYFINKSSSQLVQYALAPSTGFYSITANLPATVQNSGLEWELNARILEKGRLKWSAFANLSIPRNKLLRFPGLENSSYASDLIVGESLNITKTVDFLGVDPSNGQYLFNDLNKDGYISSNDATGFETLNQKFSCGLQNVLSFGNLELDFLLQFVRQSGYNYFSIIDPPGGMLNQPVEVMDRWQMPGDAGKSLRYAISSTSGAYGDSRFSSLVIGDASYLRLKNISLGYHLGEAMIRKLKLSGARLYVQAQNLVTITRFKGLDPETQRFYTVPNLRIMTLGLNISI